MKRLISFLLLFYGSMTFIQAQLTLVYPTNTFRIYIENSEQDPPFLYQYPSGEYYVSFSDPGVNAIFSNYVYYTV